MVTMNVKNRSIMGSTTFHYSDSAARSKEVESIRRNNEILKNFGINKT